MARLGLEPGAPGQFAALIRLQWRAFLNSAFRTNRNRLELLARIPVALTFAAFGLGGAVGLGIGAWYAVHAGRTEYLAALLWGVFAYWQLFPIIATTFNEQIDSSQLLRFPLDFRSYVLIRLAYGLFDPVPAVGGVWLLGITIGTTIARPLLLPWTAFVLIVFAAFNLVLARAIFSWTERWLARRRTREIVSVLLFLVLMAFQAVGPLSKRFVGAPARDLQPLVTGTVLVQRLLPPGLAGEALASAVRGRLPAGAAYASGLLLFLVLTGWLLGVRLHAEYRGENLSEGRARPDPGTVRATVRRGWPGWGLPAPVAAVFEKELRAFVRSPPLMVFMFLMPLVVLLPFMFGYGGSGDHRDAAAFLARTPDLALPIAMAYALALLANLSHNSLGTEGGGVQFLFVSPVRFRMIVLGKNLAYAAIVAAQLTLLWLLVAVMSRPPSRTITLVTIAGLLFATPVEFSAGNLLSIWFPKRADFARFGRQRTSGMTAFAGLVVHVVTFGLAALVIAGTGLYAGLWLAAPVLLVLAAGAFAGYLLLLSRLDGMAIRRRETIVGELSRTDAA